jgi:hypothetical protein
MADLYHFYIIRKQGAKREDVEAILNQADDWLRYYDNSYIVQTTIPLATWKERLEPVFKPAGHLFMCKFDKANYQGWMPKKFWDWYETKLSG